MTEQPLEADAVSTVEADVDPLPEQTDNRPRPEDGEQLPEDAAADPDADLDLLLEDA